MAEDEEGREWIVEPPGPGEVALQLSVGDGVKLSDEQRVALEALLKSFERQEAEVVGHAMVSSVCGKLTCPKVDCAKLDCTLTAGLARVGASWSIMGTFTPPR